MMGSSNSQSAALLLTGVFLLRVNVRDWND